MKKHGPGYSSGRFGPEKSQIDSEDSEDEVAIDVLPPEHLPTNSTAASKESEHCHLCNGTEENRLVGMGLSIEFIAEEI